MKQIFMQSAQKSYDKWQKQDPAKAKKIDRLLEAIQSDPFNGIGKPEPLKFALKGCWSRRIDSENRLVYRIAKDTIFVLQVEYHYHK